MYFVRISKLESLAFPLSSSQWIVCPKFAYWTTRPGLAANVPLSIQLSNLIYCYKFHSSLEFDFIFHIALPKFSYCMVFFLVTLTLLISLWYLLLGSVCLCWLVAFAVYTYSRLLTTAFIQVSTLRPRHEHWLTFSISVLLFMSSLAFVTNISLISYLESNSAWFWPN